MVNSTGLGHNRAMIGAKSRLRQILVIAVLFFHPLEAMADDRPLIMSVHPYLPASELIRRFKPMVEQIGQELGRPVRLEVQPDYASNLKAIESGRADFAYIGPAAYVRLVANYGKVPLLGRLSVNGSPLLHGAIIVRDDSPVQSIKDLDGKHFAFASPDSTMGHTVPRYLLNVNNVTLGAQTFVSAHVNVVLGVLMGRFDAGAVKHEVWEEYKDRGLRSLAPLPPVSEHLFVASHGMDARLVENLRRVMLTLAPEVVGGIASGVDAIVTVADSDYDDLRATLGMALEADQ